MPGEQEQEQQSNNNGGGQHPPGGTGDGSTDKGFPENTPLAEMTVEQREAYWKHQARKHENTVKGLGDVEALKAKAQKWDQHEQEQIPAQERAITEAREAAKAEGAAEARKLLAPQLVKAEFKTAAAGKVATGVLDPILEDLNFDLYIKDDGSVDVDRVKSRIDALPSITQHKTGNHQGYRPSSGSSSVSAGQELFNARRNKTNS